MLILKALSALLSYPTPELRAALSELEAAIAAEDRLPERDRTAVRALLEELSGSDLLELQERYVELFDRGRALSLHLFEHVHGESRDRGQAMVNLLQMYEANGLQLAARELPDYLPLVLEYLAQRPEEEARALLRDAMHVLALLGARLRSRASGYAAVFDALASLAGAAEDCDELRIAVAAEGPDETLVHMDRIWEEEAVRFMPDGGACGRPQPDVSPVEFAPRAGKRSPH